MLERVGELEGICAKADGSLIGLDTIKGNVAVAVDGLICDADGIRGASVKLSEENTRLVSEVETLRVQLSDSSEEHGLWGAMVRAGISKLDGGNTTEEFDIYTVDGVTAAFEKLASELSRGDLLQVEYLEAIVDSLEQSRSDLESSAVTLASSVGDLKSDLAERMEQGFARLRCVAEIEQLCGDVNLPLYAVRDFVDNAVTTVRIWGCELRAAGGCDLGTSDLTTDAGVDIVQNLALSVEALSKRVPELEAAVAVRTAELGCASAQVAELEAAAARVMELEAVVAARVSDLDAAAARVVELEGAVARIPDLEAAAARIPDLEAAAERAPELKDAAVRIRELEAAAARVVELETVVAARTSDLEAAAARIVELEGAVARIPELEAAAERVPGLEDAVARIPELEAAAARVVELETVVAARTSDLEAAAARIVELEGAVARIPELEAAAERVPGLEDAVARIPELEAAAARVVELETVVAARTSDLEAAAARIVELEGAVARIPELEAAAERVPGLEDAVARIPELEAAAAASASELEAASERVHDLEQAAAFVPELDVAATIGPSEPWGSSAQVVELEAAAARVVELEAVVTARASDLEAAAARIVELEGAAARIPELEAAAERVPELEAASARIPELEAAATARNAAAAVRSSELEAAAARIVELEEAAGCIPELEGAAARVPELEEAAARIPELEAAAAAHISELAAATARVVELERTAASIPELEEAAVRPSELEVEVRYLLCVESSDELRMCCMMLSGLAKSLGVPVLDVGKDVECIRQSYLKLRAEVHAAANVMEGDEVRLVQALGKSVREAAINQSGSASTRGSGSVSDLGMSGADGQLSVLQEKLRKVRPFMQRTTELIKRFKGEASVAQGRVQELEEEAAKHTESLASCKSAVRHLLSKLRTVTQSEQVLSAELCQIKEGLCTVPVEGSEVLRTASARDEELLGATGELHRMQGLLKSEQNARANEGEELLRAREELLRAGELLAACRASEGEELLRVRKELIHTDELLSASRASEGEELLRVREELRRVMELLSASEKNVELHHQNACAAREAYEVYQGDVEQLRADLEAAAESQRLAHAQMVNGGVSALDSTLLPPLVQLFTTCVTLVGQYVSGPGSWDEDAGSGISRVVMEVASIVEFPLTLQDITHGFVADISDAVTSVSDLFQDHVSDLVVQLTDCFVANRAFEGRLVREQQALDASLAGCIVAGYGIEQWAEWYRENSPAIEYAMQEGPARDHQVSVMSGRLQASISELLEARGMCVRVLDLVLPHVSSPVRLGILGRLLDASSTESVTGIMHGETLPFCIPVDNVPACSRLPVLQSGEEWMLDLCGAATADGTHMGHQWWSWNVVRSLEESGEEASCSLFSAIQDVVDQQPLLDKEVVEGAQAVTVASSGWVWTPENSLPFTELLMGMNLLTAHLRDIGVEVPDMELHAFEDVSEDDGPPKGGPPSNVPASPLGAASTSEVGLAPSLDMDQLMGKGQENSAEGAKGDVTDDMKDSAVGVADDEKSVVPAGDLSAWCEESTAASDGAMTHSIDNFSAWYHAVSCFSTVEAYAISVSRVLCIIVKSVMEFPGTVSKSDSELIKLEHRVRQLTFELALCRSGPAAPPPRPEQPYAFFGAGTDYHGSECSGLVAVSEVGRSKVLEAANTVHARDVRRLTGAVAEYKMLCSRLQERVRELQELQQESDDDSDESSDEDEQEEET